MELGEMYCFNGVKIDVKAVISEANWSGSAVVLSAYDR